MVNPEILITITGPANSGKSALVQLIQDYLALEQDLNITLDKESMTAKEGSLRSYPDLCDAIDSIRDKVKIVITDKQTPRKHGDIVSL
jgi:uridine kinase